jgi:hypothetical protein
MEGAQIINLLLRPSHTSRFSQHSIYLQVWFRASPCPQWPPPRSGFHTLPSPHPWSSQTAYLETWPTVFTLRPKNQYSIKRSSYPSPEGGRQLRTLEKWISACLHEEGEGQASDCIPKLLSPASISTSSALLQAGWAREPQIRRPTHHDWKQTLRKTGLRLWRLIATTVIAPSCLAAHPNSIFLSDT